MTLAARLPEYPWDELAPIAEKARAFPGGAVDLSVGTPVDPVPAVIQDALAAAANAPGYPLTAGTPELRSAAAGWLARSLDVHVDPVSVLPVIGTKEFIAWLPTMLGLGPAHTVLYPSLAYPTYDIGAKLCGAASAVVSDVADGVLDHGVLDQAVPDQAVPDQAVLDHRALADAPITARLLWVNSPSNPTGRVLPAASLRDAVGWARARGAVLASDECYITLGWDTTPVSVLHESVRGDSLDGVLAVFSLSKRSNLAGYRAGFVTGDPALMKDLLLVGRQAGMIVPGPVQAAMIAALSDDAHAAEQKARYAARRAHPRRGAHRGGLPHRALRGRALPVGHPPRAGLLGRLRAARHRVRPARRPRFDVRARGQRLHPRRADRDGRASRGRGRPAPHLRGPLT